MLSGSVAPAHVARLHREHQAEVVVFVPLSLLFPGAVVAWILEQGKQRSQRQVSFSSWDLKGSHLEFITHFYSTLLPSHWSAQESQIHFGCVTRPVFCLDAQVSLSFYCLGLVSRNKGYLTFKKAELFAMKILPAHWHFENFKDSNEDSHFLWKHIYFYTSFPGKKKKRKKGYLFVYLAHHYLRVRDMRTWQKENFLMRKTLYGIGALMLMYLTESLFYTKTESFFSSFLWPSHWNNELNSANTSMFLNTSWRFFVDKGNRLGIHSLPFGLSSRVSNSTVSFHNPRRLRFSVLSAAYLESMLCSSVWFRDICLSV